MHGVVLCIPVDTLRRSEFQLRAGVDEDLLRWKLYLKHHVVAADAIKILRYEIREEEASAGTCRNRM